MAYSIYFLTAPSVHEHWDNLPIELLDVFIRNFGPPEKPELTSAIWDGNFFCYFKPRGDCDRYRENFALFRWLHEVGCLVAIDEDRDVRTVLCATLEDLGYKDLVPYYKGIGWPGSQISLHQSTSAKVQATISMRCCPSFPQAQAQPRTATQRNK